MRLYRLHETNTIYVKVLRTTEAQYVCWVYRVYTLSIQSLFSDIACKDRKVCIYGLTPVNKHPLPALFVDPYLHLNLAFLRPHATLLSKSQKKLPSPALPTSPKRSGDHALNMCVLPLPMKIYPNRRIEVPVREPWELDCTYHTKLIPSKETDDRGGGGYTFWFTRLVDSQRRKSLVWWQNERLTLGGINW